jgi:hypothetical protein
MIDLSHVPAEFMPQIRGIFLAFFGGREKFDCWLTRIADDLSNPNNPSARPVKIDPAIIPMNFQALMDKPKEVVDLFIETTDCLSVFGYTTKVIKRQDEFLALVFDQSCGHVIEEMAGPDPDRLTLSLREKYGNALAIVKE